MSQRFTIALSRLGLLLALALQSTASPAFETGEPIPVTHSISIENGNWVPLSLEDMRRAAGDTALSRLTDAGRLQVVTGSAAPAAGSLRLEISLIGPAETAKLTITLGVPGSPTLVSTASISVRALDHAGIHDAFEHVGERAADRLVAKLHLLGDGHSRGSDEPRAILADSERRSTYDEAQNAKRRGEYADARAGFESVVASAPKPTDTLRQLAEDELRYGLPAFEAQQALVALGGLTLPGRKDERQAALSRAENLYRQIQAENPSDVQRVSEAQRALDSIVVVRGALANAMRANMLARMQSFRMMLLEHSMIEGTCPDQELAERLMSGTRTRMVIDGTSPVGDRGQRYRLSDHDSQSRVDLVCTEFGVEIVDAGASSKSPPASIR